MEKKQENREKPVSKRLKIRYTKVIRKPKNIDKSQKEYKKRRKKSELNQIKAFKALNPANNSASE